MPGVADHERKRITVEGRVQGVGFRFFVRDIALRLGLTGAVRNLPDGRRVEAHLQGPATDVARCLAAIRRGPPGSLVSSFHVADEPIAEHEAGFHITH